MADDKDLIESFQRGQVYAQWGTAVGGIGSGITSAFGAIGAGFDVYDKLGPGRRYTKKTRKLQIKELRARIAEVEARTALCEVSAQTLGRLHAGLHESAVAKFTVGTEERVGKLVLHVLSS